MWVKRAGEERRGTGTDHGRVEIGLDESELQLIVTILDVPDESRRCE